MNNVAAIVVTFNRKQLLLECLNALINQSQSLKAIYIVDNASTDGTIDSLKEKGYVTSNNDVLVNGIRINYIRLEENTGGAGGFYTGMQEAAKQNYDWLWIMDDDAIPYRDALENLLSNNIANDVVALSSKVIDSNGEIQLFHRGNFNYNNMFPHLQSALPEKEYSRKVMEIDFASFVGIMVKSSIIKEIGLPNKEFFIHNDDLEYSIRLREKGKILLVPGSTILHKEVAKAQMIKKFLNIKMARKPINQHWISYYGIRNLLIIGKEHHNNKLSFYYQSLKHYSKEIIKIIILDDSKIKRIKLVNKSYNDGFKGIVGKRVNNDYFK